MLPTPQIPPPFQLLLKQKSDSEEPEDSSISSEAENVRCYFVYKCDFFENNVAEDETDLAKISDKAFSKRQLKIQSSFTKYHLPSR